MTEQSNIENPNGSHEEGRWLSPLEMRLSDHNLLGSTPPDILRENPEKTEGELMSDEEILEWLQKQQGMIEKFSSEGLRENSFAQSWLPTGKKDFETTIQYLRRIGRLPDEFKDTGEIEK